MCSKSTRSCTARTRHKTKFTYGYTVDKILAYSAGIFFSETEYHSFALIFDFEDIGSMMITVIMMMMKMIMMRVKSVISRVGLSP